MKRLYDLLGGTRYACDWHAKDMRARFNEMIQQGDTDKVDLGGMGLTVEACRTVLEYGDRIYFCNTIDPELDAILKHNREVLLRHKQGVLDKMQTVQTQFVNMQELAEYIQNLQGGTVIKILGTSSRQSAYAVCHILAALRPDVKINFGVELPNYFADVRRYWLQGTVGHWDSYWEVSGNTIIRRNVEEGVINLSAQEQMGEDQYRARYLVIPCAFGQDAKIKDCPEFKLLFESAFRILENAMRPAPSLRDYLEVDEDGN